MDEDPSKWEIKMVSDTGLIVPAHITLHTPENTPELTNRQDIMEIRPQQPVQFYPMFLMADMPSFSGNAEDPTEAGFSLRLSVDLDADPEAQAFVDYLRSFIRQQIPDDQE